MQPGVHAGIGFRAKERIKKNIQHIKNLPLCCENTKELTRSIKDRYRPYKKGNKGKTDRDKLLCLFSPG